MMQRIMYTELGVQRVLIVLVKPSLLSMAYNVENFKAIEELIEKEIEKSPLPNSFKPGPELQQYSKRKKTGTIKKVW